MVEQKNGQSVRGRKAGFALCLIPWFLCLLLIFRYGFDAPYWDQWWTLDLIRKAFDGDLVLGDFWNTVNEHRVFFPNFVTVALARLTHWNHWVEMSVNLVLSTVTFMALIGLVLRLEKSTHDKGNLWVLPLMAMLFFSMAQWRNWTWGFHILIFMAELFAILCLLCLAVRKTRPSTLAAAIALGIAATYSSGPGIVVWPAGLALLAFRPETRRPPFLLAWIAAAAATLTVYFVGYQATAANESALVALRHPIALLAYALAYLGAPLATYSPGLAIACTAVGAAIFVHSGWKLYRSGNVDKNALAAVWAIALFAVGVAVLTGLKHVREDLVQALSSRFTTWSTLFWIALVIEIYLLWLCESKATRYIVVASVIALLVLGSGVHSVYRVDERHDAFRIGRAALVSHQNDDDLRWLYPDPKFPKDARKILVKYKLSVFRE